MPISKEWSGQASKYAKQVHWEYLTDVTDVGTDLGGRVIVHNNARPARVLGERGFRAWLQDYDAEHLEACDCQWGPPHFRVVVRNQKGSSEQNATPRGR